MQYKRPLFAGQIQSDSGYIRPFDFEGTDGRKAEEERSAHSQVMVGGSLK